MYIVVSKIKNQAFKRSQVLNIQKSDSHFVPDAENKNKWTPYSSNLNTRCSDSLGTSKFHILKWPINAQNHSKINTLD